MILKPQRSCKPRLAVFSGKMPVCTVQIPAASDDVVSFSSGEGVARGVGLRLFVTA